MRYIFKSQTFFWFAAALSFWPAVATGLMIYYYGISVPYWDQWDAEAPLFLKQHDGTLGWSDLFVQHNEHRIFFPGILMIGLAGVTHWNIRLELLATWLLGCICSFNLWQISRSTGWKNSLLGVVLLMGANILLFSLLSYEDWLWGFQIGFLLPLACMTASIWVVASTRAWIAFPSVFVLATICTFSIASGIICWILVLPIVLFLNDQFNWQARLVGSVLIFVGAVACGCLYFHSFVKADLHQNTALILDQPLTTLQYFLTYLGAPLGHGTPIELTIASPIAGAIMVALFMGSMAYLGVFWCDLNLRARILPWLLLAFISVLNGTLTTIGRIGLGIAQGTASRYIPWASMLPIALLFLATTIYLHARERMPSGWARLLGFTVAFLLLAGIGLNLAGSFSILDSWKNFREERLIARALVETIHVVDRPEWVNVYIYPGNQYAADQCDKLDKIGYLHPALLKSGLVDSLTSNQKFPDGACGYLDEIVKTADGKYNCRGWAVLPLKNKRADVVLLTYDNDLGQPTIFDLVLAGFSRPDVAQKFPAQNFLDSGFEAQMKATHLPTGTRIIRAWAFDAEDSVAYPLHGQSIISN